MWKDKSTRIPKTIIYLFIWPCPVACASLVPPSQGPNLCLRVLTTGLPGKSFHFDGTLTMCAGTALSPQVHSRYDVTPVLFVLEIFILCARH